MTKGRQSLKGGACTVTIILTKSQREELGKRAMKQRKALGRYVSTSEVVRQAVALYLAADSFFEKEIA